MNTPMRILFYVFLLFLSGSALSQVSSNVYLPYQRVTYAGDLMSRFLVEQVPGQPQCFKKTYPYSSTNLYLYADSSFVIYFVSLEHYQMAVGRWALNGNMYQLSSDSAKTRMAVSNPEFYKTYFKFKTPEPFYFDAVELVLDGNVLVRAHKGPGKENRIELLRSAEDLYKHNAEIENFSKISYNRAGDKLVLLCGEHTFEFPKKEIWGFLITQNNQSKVYRRTDKGFNWYGIPGAQIAQMDDFIIYTVGEDRLYSYFSRTLDSKIFPLKYAELKKEFKDKPAFTEAVLKEFGANRSLNALDHIVDGYRVMELYKASEKAVSEK